MSEWPSDRFRRDDDVELGAMLVRTWGIRPDPTASARARTRAEVGFAAAHRGRAARIAVSAGSLAIALVLGSAAIVGSEKALPGEPAYAIKVGLERLDVAIAADPVAETNAWLAVAEHRLEEAVRLGAEVESALPTVLTGYREAMQAARDAAATAPPGEPSELVRAELQRAESTHLIVLTELLDEVPPPARAGIRRALDAASTSPTGSGPPTWRSDDGPPFPSPEGGPPFHLPRGTPPLPPGVYGPTG